MKKFLALLCAAMLLLAIPALANPSISELKITVVDAKVAPTEDDNVSAETQGKLDDGWYVVVIPIDEEKIDLVKNPDIKEVINSVNLDAEEAITPADIADKLDFGDEDKPEEEKVDLTGYDFVAGFSALALTDGTEYYLSPADETITTEVKADIDQLKGVKPEDLGNYKLLFVNGESGKAELVDLDAEKFDSEKGELEQKFPFFGPFALIQKVA